MYKTIIILWCFICSMLLSGCLVNHYEIHYVDMDGSKKVKSIHGDTPVVLKTATTEEDVLRLMEDGYVSVGFSSFCRSYTPMSLAVDTAEKHGAALVLLDIRFKETKESTSVIYLPSISTTYHSGTINTSNGLGLYSGTSSTTTYNAMPVTTSVELYTHDAMFFKKVDVSKTYGVRYYAPKRLPTDPVDGPVQVRVIAVLHGTQAELDGIKRGQIIKAVNGVPIKTRKDLILLEGVIKNMEVFDEQ